MFLFIIWIYSIKLLCSYWKKGVCLLHWKYYAEVRSLICWIRNSSTTYLEGRKSYFPGLRLLTVTKCDQQNIFFRTTPITGVWEITISCIAYIQEHLQAWSHTVNHTCHVSYAWVPRQLHFFFCLFENLVEQCYIFMFLLKEGCVYVIISRKESERLCHFIASKLQIPSVKCKWAFMPRQLHFLKFQYKVYFLFFSATFYMDL